MTEWVAITITASVIVTGCLSLKSIRQTERHAEQIRKIESINIARKMRGYWGKEYHPSVSWFLDHLEAGQISENHPNLLDFLDNLDAVAVYWKEEIILEDHIKKFFWRDLKLVLKDPAKKRWQANLHRYPNLMELLEKSKEWKA